MRSFVHSFVHSCVRSVVRWLVPSFVRSCVRSLVRSLARGPLGGRMVNASAFAVVVPMEWMDGVGCDGRYCQGMNFFAARALLNGFSTEEVRVPARPFFDRRAPPQYVRRYLTQTNASHTANHQSRDFHFLCLRTS